MSVYQIKFKYQNVTRRISIAASSSEGGLAMPVLATKASQLYMEEETIDASTLRFIYQDEDGDSVTITSQEELDEAIRILRATSQDAPFRFSLQAGAVSGSHQPLPAGAPIRAAAAGGAGAGVPEPEAPCHGIPSATCQHAHHCLNTLSNAPGSAAHHGVECDGCGMNPIIGTRYKCLVRDNYDLCAACEANKVGTEVSLRIEEPMESALDVAGIGWMGRGGRGAKHWLRRMLHGGAPSHEQHARHHDHGRGHGYGHGHGHGHGQRHGRHAAFDTGSHASRTAAPAPPCSDSDQQHQCRRESGRGRLHHVLNAFEQHAGTVGELKAELERCFFKAASASAATAGGGGHGAAAHQQHPTAPWLPWMQAASDAVCAVSEAAEKLSGVGLHGARTVDEDAAADESILQDVLTMSMQGQGALPTTTTAAAAGGGDGKSTLAPDPAPDPALAPAPVPAVSLQQLKAELERDFSKHACHTSAAALQAQLERAFGIHAPTSAIAKLQDELLRAAGASAADGNGCECADDDAEDVPMNVTSTLPGPPRLMCRYVRDLTYPDGTEVASGSQFFKTWRIRNDGQSDWPEGCALQFSGGDDLTYICNDITPAKVGQEIDVSVALIAPDAEGRYTIYFRVSAPDGKLFGQRFWADVRVVPSFNGDDSREV